MTLYSYDDKGELESTGIDMNRNDTLESSIDRRTRYVTDCVTNVDNGTWYVERRRTYVWDNSGSEVCLSTNEQALNGTISWTRTAAGTSRSWTVHAGDGFRYVTNTANDGRVTLQTYYDGQLLSVQESASGVGTLQSLAFEYDEHGRMKVKKDNRTGTELSSAYNDADLTVTNTSTATGLPDQTTSFTYNNMGGLWITILPDSGTVTNLYDLKGQLTNSAGRGTYPVAYTYDSQGRIKTLSTWQDYAASSGKATTTWKYDGYRGWLTNKTYQTTNGPSYAYTLAGRLKTRTWARGVTTTYSTNAAGEVIGIDYSDTTPDVSFGRDRQGRVIAVTNGSSITSISYNEAGQVLSETRDGLAVTNAYDSLLRLSAVGYDGANANPAQYGYDAASRVSTLTHGLNTATYNYVENSSLIGDIQFRTNGNLRMSANRQYDNLNRLTSVSNQDANGAVLHSFGYAYNLANQRTDVAIGGTMATGPGNVSYEYDELGQLTNAVKRWPDGVLVAGQQFAYDFDDIGNRLWTKAGGDASGEGLRLANYTNNLLNQITGRGVPGTNDVIGIAHASATVTINGQSTYRKGEYYHLAIGTNNSSPISLWVTNVATLGTNSQSTTGRLVFAKAGESITYDADGNKTGDSRFWYYLWDAENRLKTALGWYPSDVRFRVDCTYDYMHRRVSKSVSNWTGSTFLLDYQRKFVYQGWNLVAELDGTNGLLKTHHWGTDASGTMQGAGGVGGLLATVFHTGQYAGTYFPAYDGNWNALKYIRASDGAVVAEYEFTPFGKLLRASGLMAKEFNFLFSTKYYDWETGLYYYGYRYYDPDTGRWLNGDPMGEQGGMNLYAFTGNQPVSCVDISGLYRFMGLNYSYGTASGSIGPGNRAFVRWRSGILKLRIDEEMLECGLCCLEDVEFYMTLTVFLPVVGDVLVNLPRGYLGGAGGAIKATAGDVANLAAHEQVHVQHGLAVGSAIFPDIESKCSGKCWRRPWGGWWSKNECGMFLFNKMSAYDQKVTDWNAYGPGGLGGAWDTIFTAHSGGAQYNFRVETTETMRSEFQVIQKKRIAGWLKEPWCSDGF